MTKRHWRELVEIVGVVGIVAVLLLVASQLRQTNQINAAQARLQIAARYNELHVERATNPEFAKLFPKLEAPEAHLTTATEASQIRGIAWHYMNNLYAVHTAYETGLISRESRDEYVLSFAHTLDQWPGLRSHVAEIYENLGASKSLEVYSPIVAYIAAQAGETGQ